MTRLSVKRQHLGLRSVASPAGQSLHAGWRCMHTLAWLISTATALNVVYFVWTVTSPVIQSDAWYFLDVFVRKAIVGNLSFGDFFVRRAGADHSQPLFKLALLLEWRYFDLDFMIEALVGVAATFGSALLLRRIVFQQALSGGGDLVRCITWTTICALLFSLNAEAGTWIWSLVALEQVVTLCILGYIAVAWLAIVTERCLLLALATVVVCVSCDDAGMLAATSVMLAMIVSRCGDKWPRLLPLWKILLAVMIPMLLVRIGYAFAPVVGTTKAGALTSHIGILPQRFREGGYWLWITAPLVLPVYYHPLTASMQLDSANILLLAAALVLLIAHVTFWRRAFLGNYNAAIFMAIVLMLVTYGQIVGIIVGRVAFNGNDYIYQPRYMVRFVDHLIALLLMWSGSRGSMVGTTSRRIEGSWMLLLPSIGCLILLVLQVPLSIHAWHLRPYEWKYQVALAKSVQMLTVDPANEAACLPEVRVCASPPEERRELAQTLLKNRLNVFSQQVQRRHPQLPALSMTPNTTSPSEANPAM